MYITITDLLGEVHSVGYQTKSEQKYFRERKRNDLNSYYETQNQEMTDILSFGCLNACKINFDDEIKRVENLKYYNEIIDVPFELSEFEQRYKLSDTTGLEFYYTRVLKNSIYPKRLYCLL